MPTADCQCAMLDQTNHAGPGLMVCHHYTNEELAPIIQNLDVVIQQFDVGINPEFILDTPLRNQLEDYFEEVWETARQMAIDDEEDDPGRYRKDQIPAEVRLVLTIAFMRHLSLISQLLMAAIVEHLNDDMQLPPESETDTETDADAQPAEASPEETP